MEVHHKESYEMLLLIVHFKLYARVTTLSLHLTMDYGRV